jgi:hypothetical protein
MPTATSAAEMGFIADHLCQLVLSFADLVYPVLNRLAHVGDGP